MDQAALTEAFDRIAHARNPVGCVVLPSRPDRELIATAYDDHDQQSLYLQPLEAMTAFDGTDPSPVVYVRSLREDGTFGRWELRQTQDAGMLDVDERAQR